MSHWSSLPGSMPHIIAFFFLKDNSVWGKAVIPFIVATRGKARRYDSMCFGGVKEERSLLEYRI